VANESPAPCFIPGGLSLSSCSAQLPEANKTKSKQESSSSIGTATMTKDGTIILRLRSKSPDGSIGEAQLVYPKDHKQYSEILKHLGGLKPGESKSVPPWPDK
jgi:hypothetical protein